MKKIFKIILISLYFAIIFVFFAFIIYKNFISRNSDPYSIKEILSAILVLTFAFAKIYTRFTISTKKSLRFYKKFYKENIQDSFDDNPKAMRKLLKALSLYNENKYEKSINLLENLRPECKTSGEKRVVELFIALNYTDSGDLAQAINVYENIIKNSCADSTIFSNLLNAYIESGEYEKAYEAGRNAINLDPKNPASYNNMAHLCFNDGDYDKAIEYCQKCLNLKNNFPQALSLLYIIYNLIGDNEKAKLYEKKAIAAGNSKKELKQSLDYYMED